MERTSILSNLCKNYKIIQDKIHGMMNISQLAMIIIDTPLFQRLRNLKQLGVCYLVFPNAVHTRFEHSLGAYHLAKKLLNNLIINSDIISLSEPLKNITYLHEYFDNNSYILDDYIRELICIAALCHDLGHGPFSHIFDDKFIPMISDKYNIDLVKHHEYRSCVLLRTIIKSTSLSNLITDDEIEFMCSLINPDKNKHQGYIYQIVSNTLNGLDVDKYDYLVRDSMSLGISIAFSFDKLINNAKVVNNKIVFPKHIDSDIINLFTTRHYMHRKIYSHKVVISIDILICQLMQLLEPELNIGRLLENLDENFINLTDDDILIRAKYSSNPDIKRLINNIITHNFYPILYSTTLDYSENVDIYLAKLFADKNITGDKLITCYHNIGYTNSKNPLHNIYVYTNKDNKLINLIDFNITKLLPNQYQEKILMIFYNGNKHDSEFIELRDLFQV